ncbi:HD domain-containing protein [Methyloversatilis sp.]|uniref:HD domain-containing protein n=1 Tax=Methyloversatilis sp. TaxID=2569862 RepID=UPI003D2AC49A
MDLPSPLPRLFAALNFAALKHSGQLRKSADMSPYINHPISVADILAREGGIADPDTLAAALLHDTLEDTDTHVTELESLFGAQVSAVVAELTDDMTLPKPERKALQILLARDYSERARLVRLADKIANVRDVTHNPPAHWSLERRLRYLLWAGEVVGSLRGVHAALESRFDEALEQGFARLTALADSEAANLRAPAGSALTGS